MPTRGPLQHRPFVTLAEHLDRAVPAPTAEAVRAELRALVSRGALTRRDGDDVLARLGLHSRPYRWVVGVAVPVTAIVRAPNDRYAHRVGTAHLIAALSRLRDGYLTGPDTPTAPVEHPAVRSLRRLRTTRTDPHPGYPVGGIYRIHADALLAITVTGDDPDTVSANAHTRLTADLTRRTEITCDIRRMRRTGLRRLTDLDHTDNTDNTADQPRRGPADQTSTPAHACSGEGQPAVLERCPPNHASPQPSATPPATHGRVVP
ncbi:hypothetical protein [Rhizomonospora bruguierae]|uniref:hypothetical protein n=1 Tax=Rhizomonospora bruguierae TaxID=1581705 RepID=UPI001BCFABE2|nr:hypothetical protein [Micromonospora sp. NBRC 107566]